MKHKMEDAVAATKAAIAEGIVAGGGTAFVKAALVASEQFKKEESKVENDFKAGYLTVIKALEEPLRQIVGNAGMSDASVVLNKVSEEKSAHAGYNAATDSYESDMLKAGIIDPLKVTRTALENAVSVAALLLTTEAAVVDLPEEKKVPDMSAMGGGMPGMM
jgi:chaperonin GroEL